MKIMRGLLGTDESSWMLLVQRILLAAVMLPHGLQKLLGWYGGQGFSATVQQFQEHMGIPAALAVLVIISETVGSIGMFLGALTRVAALGTTAVMLGAVFMAHGDNGFFMNWQGQKGGEGFEYHLLALALSIPIVLKGAGMASLDAWFLRQLEKWRSRRKERVVDFELVEQN